MAKTDEILVEGSTIEATVTEITPPKRGRGRPPGSKNKPKAEDSGESQVEKSESPPGSSSSSPPSASKPRPPVDDGAAGKDQFWWLRRW